MSRRLSLQRLLISRGTATPDHLPGDQCECPDCRGTLHVYATKYQIIGEAKWKVRYLQCGECHHKPEGNKNLIPPDYSY